MVKLIRLQGDSDVNSEEIRNKFRQPIIIQPNAKVALVGASALLNDRIVNEAFVVSDFNKYFKTGVQAVNPTVGQALLQYNSELTNGNYGAYEFCNEFCTAMNYSCSDASAGFNQFQTSIIDGKIKIDGHRCGAVFPQFTDASLWNVYDGSYSSVTANSLVAGPTGLKISSAAKINCSIPMFHNFFRATVVDPKTGLQINASVWDVNTTAAPIAHIFGVRIDASGNYLAQYYNAASPLSPTEVAVGTTWAANDVVRMYTRNGKLIISVTSSGGALKASLTSVGVIPRSFYSANAEKLDYSIEMSASSNITSCLSTILKNIPDNPSNLQDSEARCSLQFQTPTGDPNVMLATYCGFGLVGSSQIFFNGNPAVLNGRDVMLGVATYPSILVAVDGLGPLQSYDGSADSKSQDNVLYGINDLSVIKSNQLQLDVPNLFYLDIKNSSVLNINELRARFLPSAGSVSNKALSFSGKPSLTILIDG